MSRDLGVLVVLALAAAIMMGCETGGVDLPPHPMAEALAGKWQGVLLAEEGCQVAALEFEFDAKGDLVRGQIDFGDGPIDLWSASHLTIHGGLMFNFQGGSIWLPPDKWQIDGDNLSGESTLGAGGARSPTQFDVNRVRE